MLSSLLLYLTDRLLPAAMVEPDWFPSWPTTSWFPFEFHTKLRSWECPTSHTLPTPREKSSVWPLDLPVSLGPSPSLSLVHSLKPQSPPSCLTTSAFHLHSLCNIVWGCLCLWVFFFFFFLTRKFILQGRWSIFFTLLY